MFSFVGDTVLDPFMGTGSTNIACARWGRNSIGIEVDPKYFEMARARIAEHGSDLYFGSTVNTRVNGHSDDITRAFASRLPALHAGAG
jgi:tRNA G10  N-methylase Trm11